MAISAPSGGGKTTVCNALLKAHPELRRAITCDYYFLSPEEFESKRQKGEFLEWANVYGNYYGTLKSEILSRLKRGEDVIVSVDVQGIASIREQSYRDESLRESLVTLFIALPGIGELKARLAGRGTDSAEVIERRLNTAKAEMETCGGFDYILLSGTREEDFERAQAILLCEKMKRVRLAEGELESFLNSFR